MLRALCVLCLHRQKAPSVPDLQEGLQTQAPSNRALPAALRRKTVPV